MTHAEYKHPQFKDFPCPTCGKITDGELYGKPKLLKNPKNGKPETMLTYFSYCYDHGPITSEQYMA